MARNPMQPPNAEQDDSVSRTAKIQALREAWLAGTLDLSVPDANALRRLLRDVFSTSDGPRVA